eukprot:scaffold22230_cov137-Isochrysis_galbana.AAC.2
MSYESTPHVITHPCHHPQAEQQKTRSYTSILAALLNARTRSGKHKKMELRHPSSTMRAHTYPRTSAHPHPCLREHVLHVGVNRRAEARDDLDARQQIEPAVEGKQRAPGKAEGVGAIRPAVGDPRHHERAAGAHAGDTHAQHHARRLILEELQKSVQLLLQLLLQLR